MEKHEFYTIVDTIFYSHFSNYIWYSLAAKDWKKYAFDHIQSKGYTKHTCILALNIIADNNQCQLDRFFEALEIVVLKQSPFCDADIAFFEGEE